MRSRSKWLASIAYDTVIVHTKDGQSIRGALAEVTTDELVLVNASFLGATVEQLAGQVAVPRANVSFLQRIMATTSADLEVGAP